MLDGPTVCQHDFQEASRNAYPGIYIPDCKPTGGYKDVQCRGSYCFCVDKRGNELKGTRMSISEGRPRCDRPGTLHVSRCSYKFFSVNERPFTCELKLVCLQMRLFLM